MRIVKLFANALFILFVLPVTIVAVLGFAFAPLQAAASAPAPHVVLEANDLPE